MKPITRYSTKSPARVSAKRCLHPEAVMLLTSILTLAPALSFAVDIHVDADQGTENLPCGLQNRPCQSISQAISGMSTTGDRIVLVGNTDFSVEGVPIPHSLSIHGTGATVLDASSNDRHFVIDSAATVSLQDMVLRNGLSAEYGGSIRLTNGDLQLTNVKFENNEALYGGALWIENGTLLSENSEFTENRAMPNSGGAIRCTGGSVELFDSTFTDNSAQREGGGMSTSCETTVRRSGFLKNSANNGGAIHSENSGDAVFDIRRVQFSQNTAGTSGGAINVEGGATDIRRSSFKMNSAFIGGGISFSERNDTEELTVINSTFSANTAENEGGAISASSGAIYFVTMVDNWADTERGLDITSNAGNQKPFGIYNSLINHNPNTIDPATALLCSGANSYTGEGNLIDNESCGSNVARVGTHQYGLLRPLKRNGGITLSHGLFPKSAALNVAASCNGPNGLNKVDQRGYPRPEIAASTCDIGAFERE